MESFEPISSKSVSQPVSFFIDMPSFATKLRIVHGPSWQFDVLQLHDLLNLRKLRKWNSPRGFQKKVGVELVFQEDDCFTHLTDTFRIQPNNSSLV